MEQSKIIDALETHFLLPHPTCPDRRCDTFHPNHRPLHQISAGLRHGARSIARISRSIWQRRSKSRPHARMRSRWLPFVPTPDLGGAPCHLLATPVKHARFTRCVCCSCLSFTNSSELCYLILPCNLLL